MPSRRNIPTQVFNESRPQYLYSGEMPTPGKMTASRMWTSESSAPSPDNDGMDTAGLAQDFLAGDFWNNQGDGNLYLCVDNTATAAVWRVAFSGTGGKIIDTVTSATATLDSESEWISVTYTITGAVTITLPAASELFDSDNNIGYGFTISDSGANASANNITVNRAGSDTIIYDATGVTSVVINTDGTVLRFMAISGTTWKVW